MLSRSSRVIGILIIGVIPWASSCAPTPPATTPTVPATSPLTSLPRLSPTTSASNIDLLKARLEQAIESVQKRDVLATHGFWTVFHGILGLGPNLTLLQEDGSRVKALEYIQKGGELRGLQFPITPYGLDVQTGPQFVGQGHQDQFIAEMIQWGIKADAPFRVMNRDFTFMDFVRHSQMIARTTADQELSWTIIVVGQHLGTDISWTNAHGEKLHYLDMIRYELDQPMDPAACGGTHRLFGLAWALFLHRQRGGKDEGVWKDVVAKLNAHVELARRYQNNDGSFSTAFFREKGQSADPQLRLNTTGHILEWLAFWLPEDQLHAPWIEDAVNALCQMLIDAQYQAVDGGSLYHAVHGLIIYYARRYDADRYQKRCLPITFPEIPSPRPLIEINPPGR